MNRQSGFVFVFFSFAIVVLLLVAAFAVDLSRVRDEERRIQYATDAAAIAGAYYVGFSADNVVTAKAQAAGGANSLSNSEMISIQCGRWIRGTECTVSSCREFMPCGNTGPCSDCSDPDANAVKTQSRRTVPTRFAKIVGQNSISPSVHSVAMATPNRHCIKPFGIVFSYITGLTANSTFTVAKNAPGNWGKIDVGGVNYSSGNNFRDAIEGKGACSKDVYIGAQVDSSTGNGGSIDHVFDDAIDDDNNLGWVLPVITQQSNGQNTVTMLEFIKVDLLSSNGSGNNWSGTFRIVARNVAPELADPSDGGQDRFLVQ